MMSTIKLDGKEYSVDELSPRAKKIINELSLLEANLNEKSQLRSVLLELSKRYVSELKSEILSSKAGLDLNQ